VSDSEQELEHCLKLIRESLDTLTTRATELAAQGMDVPAEIARWQAEEQHIRQVYAAADVANEKYLQAAADLADTEYKAFKQMCKIIDRASETHPNHPQVQKWIAVRDKLQARFPKE
jgi:hypothetical protein